MRNKNKKIFGMSVIVMMSVIMVTWVGFYSCKDKLETVAPIEKEVQTSQGISEEERSIPEAAKASVSRGRTERMIWPTYGELSSPFGYRWGRLHSGIDIANDNGTFVKAVLPGKVSYAGWQSGYGYTVIIDHNAEVSSVYGHLNAFSVRVGQLVEQGQIIAYMGSTGNSTGPHLHFEVRQHGCAVNPMPLLP